MAKRIGIIALFALALLGTATPSAAQWTAPFGIPTPPLGITETPPTYNSANTDHYYVNGLTTCNDANNGGRGSPGAPRCTVPSTLNNSDLVMVEGVATNASVNPNCGSGANLCWIVGTGAALVQTEETGEQFVIHTGQYLIIDGLTIDGTGTPTGSYSNALVITAGADHIAVRHTVIRDSVMPPYNIFTGRGTWRSAITVITASGGLDTTDIVYYDVTIDDNAPGGAVTYETGRHGVLMTGMCGPSCAPVGNGKLERVWILAGH